MIAAMDERAPAPRVLLAEDDPVSARFLREALERLGARVLHAADGPKALDAATRSGFDLLLLDLGLPGLGGGEVLARLRADPGAASRAARALATSAARRPAAEVRAAGFEGLLLKPLRIADLEAALGMPARAVREASATESAPVLDDDGALAALGSMDAVADLRRLLAAELPGQLAALRAAIASHATGDAKAVLHRLHASTRFCGAAALAAASGALARALDEAGSALAALAALEAAAADYAAALSR
jgi:CheY-like chemotaxis protein